MQQTLKAKAEQIILARHGAILNKPVLLFLHIHCCVDVEKKVIKRFLYIKTPLALFKKK